MARVSREMLLSLLMAVSGILASNLAVGLFAYAKQKRETRFLAINSSLSTVNVFPERRVQKRKRKTHWIRPGRTDLWWRNMIEGRCLPEEWKKNFRMSKEKFMELVDELEPFIAPSPRCPRPALSAAKKVGITLYYLKDSGSMSMTANAFGIAVPTVTKVVREVCMAIRVHLSPEYIKMPKDMDSVKRLVAGWEQTTGFPMVVGAVDGTHIPIIKPYINSQDYFSYKMKYTINVQGVCDYSGKFIDVDIRWPGATHDAKVFSYSSINKKIKDQTHPYLCRTLLPGRDKVGLLLLADPAYPLLPHVMKEYAHCTDDAQVVFNQMLRDARNPIECAYGRLKARWQILTVPMPLKLQDVTLVILACFVLHNWCEQHDVGIDEVALQHQINQNNAMNQKEKVDKRFTYTSAGGRATRDIIKDYFQEH